MNQTHFLGSFCWQTRTNHQRSFSYIYNPPDTMDQMSITSPTNVICFFLCPAHQSRSTRKTSIITWLPDLLAISDGWSPP
jgi:hypothetical protein